MSPISALKVSLTPFRTHESIRPISSPVVRFSNSTERSAALVLATNKVSPLTRTDRGSEIGRKHSGNNHFAGICKGGVNRLLGEKYCPYPKVLRPWNRIYTGQISIITDIKISNSCLIVFSPQTTQKVFFS